MIQVAAFYLFALLTIASAVLVITSHNPVHSVLWLIVAFFNAAGLMVLAGAEFIAMLLVIVYVGAVAVLFLFVVMMLNIDFASLRAGFVKNFPLGLLIALVLLAELVFGIGAYQAGRIELRPSTGDQVATMATSNIAEIGQVLYGQYLFLFESSGIILLVAMIGAIVLTHRERKDTRPQNISKQVRRRPQDATRNVKPTVGEGVQL
jgi:NADH-quinone oxidoreductase subunit J